MAVQTWTDEDEDGAQYVSCDQLGVGDYGGYGSIGEANIRALENTAGAFVERGAYSSRQLWLPDDEANREICRHLTEEYPVWDEETHSDVECEWEHDAWTQYGYDDLLRDMRDDEYEVMADAVADLDSGPQWWLYRGAMDRANRYPTYEYNGASLPTDEIVGDFVDLAARHIADNTAADDRALWADAITEYVVRLSACPFDAGDVEDVAIRAVCADWCEDHGHAHFAPFLRVALQTQQREGGGA